MDSKKTGLRATKLDLIRAISEETDEARLQQLAGDLISKGTPNGCALDDLCAGLEAELLEVYATITGDPGVLQSPSIRRMAKRTLGLLRAFRMLATEH